jgi:hypothetical protein
MIFYIATRLERAEEQKELSAALIALGHEISYDWSVHGSVQSEGPERIREVAIAETRGVMDAELFVCLLPGGRGTHSELGIAIADSVHRQMQRRAGIIGGQKKIVIVGDDVTDGRTCSFYHHECISERFHTDEHFIAFMRGIGAGGGWR